MQAIGVKLGKDGAVEVDDYSRTSAPGVWAVGDVTDRINLTPVALMEGMAFAKSCFTKELTKVGGGRYCCNTATGVCVTYVMGGPCDLGGPCVL